MERRVLFYCLLLIFAFLGYCNSQGVASCGSLTKCNTCIGTATCSWCSDENFAGDRCDTLNRLQALKCQNLSNPLSKATPTQNDGLGVGVQVKPQKIKLDLRAGEPAKFTLTVRPAEDYPVDLYYLMDMSHSMRDDLDNLKQLAGKIATAMKNITKDYQLGFGSFVDKTVSPFIRTESSKPCDQDQECIPAYGFRNVLSLVKNPKLFEDSVKEQNISGNLDVPEGGFDALMQVAVCENEIGWRQRETSRRLVVFVSDETFHIAGDGKLGGIVTPNDGKCHLNSNREYDKSNEQDYPSLAQLHEKLRDSNILPIFAVTNVVSDLYQSLSTMWSDVGAVAGKLDDDSGNVVSLIASKYEEIVSTVRLEYKAPEKVSVTVKAKCGGSSVSIQSPKCSNVKLGQTVTFDISVKLDECPESEAERQKSLKISVPGFGSVTLDLSFICECQCEQPNMKQNNSKICNGNGTLSCGICECNQGRFGEFCQCNTPFEQTDLSKCKRTNSSDELPCSGRGECVCGKCVCRSEQGRRFYGEFCQCNDFSCPEDQGKLCAGPDHGVCRCRKCICKDKYYGDVCNIKNCTYFPRETQCQKDANSEICGGPERGECKQDPENCFKCECKEKYDGTYCENCPYCEDGMCSRNEDCAKCSTFEGKSLDECKKGGRCEVNVLEVEVVSDITKKTDEGLFGCEALDSKDGCTYYFTTETEKDSTSFKLYVQKDKVNCPKEAPIVIIVAAVVGGIVLLGLIILALIKAFLTMVDRIEYQKFQQEQARSRWTKEKNPLYQAAKTTFENPTYAGGRPC